MEDVDLKEQEDGDIEEEEGEVLEDNEEEDEGDEDSDELEDADRRKRQDAYVDDGFVVNDYMEEDNEGEEVESGEGADKMKKKKKKRKHSVTHRQLDDDDYELLNENTGFKVQRSLTRLKKGNRSDPVPVAENIYQLEEKMFGDNKYEDDKQEYVEGIPSGSEEQEESETDNIEDVDNMGDFIVDARREGTRKQKKSGSVSTSQLAVATEIFGDLSGILNETKDKAAARKVSKEDEEFSKLHRDKGTKEEAMFEPDEVEELWHTKEDQNIVQIDIPERLQVKLKDRLKPLVDELGQEVNWVYDKISREKNNFSEHAVKEKIKIVLDLFRVEYFEGPFINTYRNHLYEPELNKKDISTLFSMDREWGNYISTRLKIQNNFHQMAHDINERECEYINEELACAKDEKELQDIQCLLELYNNIIASERFVLQESETQTLKLPSRKNYIQEAKKYKIDEFSGKVALKPSEFVKNLKSNTLVNIPPTPTARPNNLAYEYITERNRIEIDVLSSACLYLANELAAQPYIRRYVREFYFANAMISTEPTEKGKTELDVFHPSYKVKRIMHKPILLFNDEQWIDMIENEKKGLILIKIVFEEKFIDELFKKLLVLYFHDNEEAKDWNVFRNEVIRRMLKIYLLPEMEKEVRESLFDRAEKAVIQKSCDTLSKLLMTGPYYKTQDEGETTIHEKARVMSVIVEDTPSAGGPDVQRNTRAVYIAFLDADGLLLDTCIMRNLVFNNVKNLSIDDKTKFEKGKEDCKGLIKKYEPDLIVVGANCLQARVLREALRELAQEAAKSKNEEDEDFNEAGDKAKYREPWVAWGNLMIPQVYAYSESAQKHFGQLDPALRMAISLGRFKQDPISEILNLWHHKNTQKNGVLQLNLHQFQSLVNQAKLVECLEQVAIECVNSIGVDINKLIEHDHLRATLSFICGLGPRKAKNIITSLSHKGKVKMRIHLFLKKFMGKKVYTNAIGFLKVKTDAIEDEEEETMARDVLDETRIHPENYQLAKKIAVDALEEDEYAEDAKVKDQRVIEKIMKDPKKLDDLDLRGYAEEQEKSGGRKNMMIILDFVTKELTHPFKDPREAYQEIESNELFYLLISETDQIFFDGLIVDATVVYVQEDKIRCKLYNGLDAFVWKRDFYEKSENLDSKDLKKEVQEGTVVTGRIKKVHFEKFKVDLTCRRSDLISHREFLDVRKIDQQHFQIIQEDIINSNLIDKKPVQQSKYVPRKIKHPKFQNISFATAIQYLSDKHIGDCVIRPSSKGQDNLTISWKFYNNVYVHLDIQEQEKLPGSSIGQKLIIGSENFDTLQEILERYIEPCVRLVKEVITNRKFLQAGTIKEMEESLRAEKSKNETTIPYKFAILPEYPQHVVICYIPKKLNVIREYIKIKPRGFYFHDVYHAHLEHLIVWFKRNFADTSYQRFVRKTKAPQISSVSNANAIVFNPLQNLSDEGSIQNKEQYHELPDDWKDSSGFQVKKQEESQGHVKGETHFTPYVGQTDYPTGLKTEAGAQGYSEHGTSSMFTPGGQFSDYKQSSSQPKYEGWGNEPKENWGSSNDSSAGNKASGWGASSDTSWGGGNDGGSWATSNNNSGFGGDSRGDFKRPNPGGPRAGGGGGRACYNCGEEGHNSRDCPNPKKDNRPPRGACFNCGEEGHNSRDCPNPKKDTRGPKSCFNCGGEGHMSRECTEPKKDTRGPKSCFNCGGEGHMSRECTEPKKERAPRERQGGDYGSSSRDSGGDAWGSTSNSNAGGGGWGNSNTSSGGDGWGSTNTAKAEGDSWNSGNTNGKASSSGWGSSDAPKSSGWGDDVKMSSPKKSVETSGWGASSSQDTNKDTGGWGSAVEVKIPTTGWGDDPKPKETTSSGWGNEGSSSSGGWGDTSKGGGSSWGGGNESSSYERKGRGDGGGSRGPMTCFNCQKEGHMSKDCTEERKPRGGGGGGGSRGPMTCFNCQKEGHMSKDCTEERKPRGGGGGGGSRGPMTCFNCQKEGHMSKDCTEERKPRGGGGGGGGRSCFKCGKEGHMSRECTEPGEGGRFNGKRRNDGDGDDRNYSQNKRPRYDNGGGNDWGSGGAGSADVWGSSSGSNDAWGSSAGTTSIAQPVSGGWDDPPSSSAGTSSNIQPTTGGWDAPSTSGNDKKEASSGW